MAPPLFHRAGGEDVCRRRPADCGRRGHGIASVRRDRPRPAAVRDKALALRFIIHILGNSNQPLHAGNGICKGGNDVQATFNREATDLHAVWDSGRIYQEQLSYGQFTAWLLPLITRDQRRERRVTNPRRWISESAAVRDRLYPRPPRWRASR